MAAELGFGLMRLPVKNGKIEMETVCRMVDSFLNTGFNYFDTAYFYHDGKSEQVVRKALVERHPRETFRLATKMPMSFLKGKEKSEVPKIFQEQLDRTGAGYFDRYLLHAMHEGSLETADRCGVWEFVAELKKKGLAREIGFSFHDSAAVLDKMLTAHPEVDFVQLQLNYADWDSESVQSYKCWKTARRHGKKIIVMEPVKGGMLAEFGNPKIRAILASAGTTAVSPAARALHFAATREGVDIVLSGMSTEAQMSENLKTFREMKPFTQKDQEILDRILQTMRDAPLIQCTHCSYCTQACPQNIPIPNLLAVLNNISIYGCSSGVRNSYAWHTKEKKPADCVSCGACETNCPQHLSIRAHLSDLVKKMQ